MNFLQSVQSCFRKYATVKGRAPRSEFWYWQLFILLSNLIIVLLDLVIFNSSNPSFLDLIFLLGTFIPGLAVTIRRLHDIDRSGKWYFIGFTIIGIIPLIYWMFVKGTVGPNRFGDDPLA